MFKYPLAVTIDTNIFDAAKFDLCDTSTLKILENYVKSGKIKVVLSDIVVRESKRHIADQVKKICGIMRKARAAALEGSTEHLINTIGLGEILRIVTNKDELISKGEEMFDDFLRTINAEILGADLIDVGLILRALTVETLFVKIKVHLTKRFFILTERSFACNVFSCTF